MAVKRLRLTLRRVSTTPTSDLGGPTNLPRKPLRKTKPQHESRPTFFLDDIDFTRSPATSDRSILDFPRSSRPLRASTELIPPVHPDRTVDESTGITKLEVVQYYERVAPLMMEHLIDRPVTFVRVPAGLKGAHIFQKHAEVERLPGVIQLPRALEESHPPMLEVARPEGLRAAAQWNVVEFHTQNTRGADYEHPDRVVFDLDPGEGVEWSLIQQGADVVRRFVEGLGLTAFAKTSGGSGVHVVIPLASGATWDELHDFAQGVTDRLAAGSPELFVSKSGNKNRVGRIFVDWLRNGRGSTTVCAWSARARPGIGVSVPVTWDELPGLTGGAHWTIRNVGPRLEVGNRPWSDYGQAAKELSSAARALAATS